MYGGLSQGEQPAGTATVRTGFSNTSSFGVLFSILLLVVSLVALGVVGPATATTTPQETQLEAGTEGGFDILEYASNEGNTTEVTTTGLLTGIDEWREGDITTSDLLAIIDVWRSDDALLEVWFTDQDSTDGTLSVDRVVVDEMVASEFIVAIEDDDDEVLTDSDVLTAGEHTDVEVDDLNLESSEVDLSAVVYGTDDGDRDERFLVDDDPITQTALVSMPSGELVVENFDPDQTSADRGDEVSASVDVSNDTTLSNVGSTSETVTLQYVLENETGGIEVLDVNTTTVSPGETVTAEFAGTIEKTTTALDAVQLTQVVRVEDDEENADGDDIELSHSLQAAIDEAEEDGIVEASEGTFDESVTVDVKNLTVQGAGVDETTVTTDAFETVFAVQSANVTIEAFTFESGDTGIESNASLTVSENKFVDLETGIIVQDAGGAEVDGNTFEDVGMAVSIVGDAENGMVTDNQVDTDNDGVVFWGGEDGTPSTWEVTENNFDAMDTAVGFISHGDTTFDLDDGFTMSENNVNESDETGVALIEDEGGEFSGELLATDNWWGDSDGPGGVGPGDGAAVVEDVLFVPWLDAPYPDGDPVEPIDQPRAATLEADFVEFGGGSTFDDLNIVEYTLDDDGKDAEFDQVRVDIVPDDEGDLGVISSQAPEPSIEGIDPDHIMSEDGTPEHITVDSENVLVDDTSVDRSVPNGTAIYLDLDEQTTAQADGSGIGFETVEYRLFVEPDVKGTANVTLALKEDGELVGQTNRTDVNALSYDTRPKADWLDAEFVDGGTDTGADLRIAEYTLDPFRADATFEQIRVDVQPDDDSHLGFDETLEPSDILSDGGLSGYITVDGVDVEVDDVDAGGADDDPLVIEIEGEFTADAFGTGIVFETTNDGMWIEEMVSGTADVEMRLEDSSGEVVGETDIVEQESLGYSTIPQAVTFDADFVGDGTLTNDDIEVGEYTLSPVLPSATFEQIEVEISSNGETDVWFRGALGPGSFESGDGTTGHVTVDGDEILIDSVSVDEDQNPVTIELDETVTADAGGDGIEFRSTDETLFLNDSATGEADVTMALLDGDGEVVGNTDITDENALEYDTVAEADTLDARLFTDAWTWGTDTGTLGDGHPYENDLVIQEYTLDDDRGSGEFDQIRVEFDSEDISLAETLDAQNVSSADASSGYVSVDGDDVAVDAVDLGTDPQDSPFVIELEQTTSIDSDGSGLQFRTISGQLRFDTDVSTSADVTLTLEDEDGEVVDETEITDPDALQWETIPKVDGLSATLANENHTSTSEHLSRDDLRVVSYTLDSDYADAAFQEIRVEFDSDDLWLVGGLGPQHIESGDGTAEHITVDGDDVRIDDISLPGGNDSPFIIELDEEAVADAGGTGIEFETAGDRLVIGHNVSGTADVTLSLKDGEGETYSESEITDESALEYNTIPEGDEFDFEFINPEVATYQGIEELEYSLTDRGPAQFDQIYFEFIVPQQIVTFASSDTDEFEAGDGSSGYITVDGENVEIESVSRTTSDRAVRIDLVEETTLSTDGSGIEFETVDDILDIKPDANGYAEAIMRLESSDDEEVGETETEADDPPWFDTHLP